MTYNSIAGKNSSSEEISAQRIYALLYKLSSDVERLEIIINSIKKQTEVNKNGQ
ncbi:MAG: hypothetical protein J1E34_03425 [Oscillospiraceae bacterium]|nr:hypothetical protein [Oscillospiraceae bacterium]